MPKIDAPTVAEHHERKRAEIVTVAVALLAAEGAGAVTPAAVASRSGLARSSVYQYYGSTGALVGAAVEEMFRHAVDSLNHAVAGTRTPRARLTAYLDASFDEAVAGHQPLAALGDVALPRECLARVIDLHAQLLDPLVSSLTELGTADPAGTAGLVNGVVSAGAAQVVRGEPAAKVRRRVREFVLRSVAGPEPAAVAAQP